MKHHPPSSPTNYNRMRLVSLKLITLYHFIVKKELHCKYFCQAFRNCLSALSSEHCVFSLNGNVWNTSKFLQYLETFLAISFMGQ